MSCICKIKSVITRGRDVIIHFTRRWLLRHNTTNNNVQYMAPYALMVKLTGKSMTVYIFALTIRCVNSFLFQRFIRSKIVSNIKFHHASVVTNRNAILSLQHGLINRLWPLWLLQFLVLSLQEHDGRKNLPGS